MQAIKEINKLLAQNFGTLQEKPLFRVVWSEDLYEVRSGKHDEYYGEIFVRSRNGIVEVRKYNYVKNLWIMEYFDPKQCLNPEIHRGDGYEPLYVFKTKGGGYITPVYKACEFLAVCWLEKKGKHPNISNKMEASDYAAQLKQREKACFEELFGNDGDMLDQRFRTGEAVIIHRKD